ncbi:MAG: hypothetical protein M3416_03760 [Acidobacteriota bacterium]|nr:hypothetical protein [Acidobacteriota bacterium]
MRRSPLRRHVPLRGHGKKGRAWSSERRRLKERFYRRGIIYCELRYEGCYRDNFLGFAHARKRRKLRDGELGQVILACSHCHDLIERLSPDEMYDVVMSTIERREESKAG